MGVDARGSSGRRPRVGAPSAAARLARSDVPLPRRYRGAAGRRRGRCTRLAARGARVESAFQPPARAARAAGAGGAAMRRALLAALAVLAVAAPAASAHPLGNFTVNHLSAVSVSSDTVTVGYTL